MRYRSDTRLLRKILGHREDVIPMTSRSLDGLDVTHREQALRSAERGRFRKERLRKVTRRRRAVVTLLIATAGSLPIGAMPRLHLVWALTVFAGVLLISYLVLLAHFTRLEVNAAERRAKIVHLPRTVFPIAVNEDRNRDGVNSLGEGFRPRIAFATHEAR